MLHIQVQTVKTLLTSAFVSLWDFINTLFSSKNFLLAENTCHKILFCLWFSQNELTRVHASGDRDFHQSCWLLFLLRKWSLVSFNSYTDYNSKLKRQSANSINLNSSSGCHIWATCSWWCAGNSTERLPSSLWCCCY